MSHREDPQTRQVALPSGKTIKVICFEETLAALDAVTERQEPTGESDDLHLCGTCSSRLVYPLRWSEAGPRHWQVTLRCPNCEWSGTGVFTQKQVERFDEHLDRETEALVGDLQSLTVANMEDEIERFAWALASGFVLPEDF